MLKRKLNQIIPQEYAESLAEKRGKRTKLRLDGPEGSSFQISFKEFPVPNISPWLNPVQRLGSALPERERTEPTTE